MAPVSSLEIGPMYIYYNTRNAEARLGASKNDINICGIYNQGVCELSRCYSLHYC